MGMVVASLASAAEVSTQPASNITATKARLNANIAPHGKEVLYGFEYGTTTSYGSGTPGNVITSPPEFGNVSVSADIAGLLPNTTYHFRAVVYGGGTGTVYGVDKSFKTLPGFYLTGKESGTVSEQPALGHSSYPHTGSGAQVGSMNLFQSGGAVASCQGMGVVSSPFTEASNSFYLYPLASGGYVAANCEFLEEEAQVKMNGCYFTFTVANSGPPYTGSPGVGCATAGKAIEISSAGCSVSIPAQTAGGTVGYEEITAGGLGGVRLTTSASGITFTKSGPLCFLLGKTGAATAKSTFDIF
jgi:hypothetical protein